MPKRKVLICGSTGFIGRNIAENLAQRSDLEVYGVHFKRAGLEMSGIRPVYADLTDYAAVDKAISGMDVVIQAAASTSGARDIVERPYIHVTDNAVMNSLLLRASYDHNVETFIFFSCSVMYPSSEKPLKENEFDRNVEINPNYFGVGWTKVYIEHMCEFYSRLGRTRHTVLRNSNIYGPYDKFDLQRSHVFGATVNKVMEAKNDKVTVWGEGKAERDLLFVGDLVNLVEASLRKQTTSFEILNAGYGSAISIRDLVGKIIRASGKNLEIDYDLSQPSIETRLCLDISKAKRLLGWNPKVTLEKGIEETLFWYKESMLKKEMSKTF